MSFLAECNNNLVPFHVITLQETHINSNVDVQYFELFILWFMILQELFFLAIYVHDSFSSNRLDTETE